MFFFKSRFLTVLCLSSGRHTPTAPSVPQRAFVSGSRPRAKSAATITDFLLFSTKAPTCGTVGGGGAGPCPVTCRPQTTPPSCPARCRYQASWRSSAVTSAREQTTRACSPPRSPAPKNSSERPWRGEHKQDGAHSSTEKKDSVLFHHVEAGLRVWSDTKQLPS